MFNPLRQHHQSSDDTALSSSSIPYSPAVRTRTNRVFPQQTGGISGEFVLACFHSSSRNYPPKRARLSWGHCCATTAMAPFSAKEMLARFPNEHGASGRSSFGRVNNDGLKGIPARLALPEMAYAGLVEIFGPFRQKQLIAALGAFGHGAGCRRVAGIKTHGTFLTRFVARIDARRVLLCP